MMQNVYFKMAEVERKDVVDKKNTNDAGGRGEEGMGSG